MKKINCYSKIASLVFLIMFFLSTIIGILPFILFKEDDNSHYISDDYNIIVTKELIEKYVKVFKLIFEKSGHISHYEMMMSKQ